MLIKCVFFNTCVFPRKEHINVLIFMPKMCSFKCAFLSVRSFVDLSDELHLLECMDTYISLKVQEVLVSF